MGFPPRYDSDSGAPRNERLHYVYVVTQPSRVTCALLASVCLGSQATKMPEANRPQLCGSASLTHLPTLPKPGDMPG